MTHANEFLPFGTGGGANVLGQTDYAGLPARPTGFVAGIASSAAFNKVVRQASTWAAVLGQIIADYGGADALDDGDLATLETNLIAALTVALSAGTGYASVGNAVHIGTDTGSANAMVATFAPVVSSLTDGLFFEVTPAATNTGATTLNANGIGIKSVVRVTGATLTAGDIVAGAKTILAYDATLDKFVLLTPISSSLSNYVQKAGDTMTGALTLSGAPTASLHAATKAYVDAVAALLGNYVPRAGGTMTGRLTLSAGPTAALHAATKQYVDSFAASLSAYLLKSGGTMTGALTLFGAPTVDLHAATKAYVDSYSGDFYNLGALGGTATAYTAAAARPPMPSAGPRDGAIAIFTVGTTNSGTNPTLAVTGGTARGLRRGDGTSIVAGDLISGHDILARYDTSTSRWWCLVDLTSGKSVGSTTSGQLLASGTLASGASAVVTNLSAWSELYIAQSVQSSNPPTLSFSSDGGSTYPSGDVVGFNEGASASSYGARGARITRFNIALATHVEFEGEIIGMQTAGNSHFNTSSATAMDSLKITSAQAGTKYWVYGITAA